ncbi:urease subunit beta [Aeromicrobium sp.]|uniref:urease subunit beta n=1 Tax=Aeromicrobium sp. TaxID=1871063 RepID=UPI002FC89EE8
MSSQTQGPGSLKVAEGTVEINANRTPEQRRTIVIVNTGDRPVQIGSHIHLAEVNTALDFDREATRGWRLDIPSGTSRRFEPGASREVGIVTFGGRGVVPGIQIKGE